MKTRIVPAVAVVAICIMLAACSKSEAAGDIGVVKAQEARQIATDAYIFGYPLVTMEMTRRVMTNTAKPDGTHAPMGQFANARTYPDSSFRDVTAPNADTLYSIAWLELSHEPYIFSIPDSNGRYYLMPVLDAFSNVFQSPGKRTTGTKAQRYALTSPGWKGRLPAGITQYKSPTNLVWILGRTYCTGTPQDYKEVHAFQDQLSLVPLSAYGKTYRARDGAVNPKIDKHTAIREQVSRMDGAVFFKLMMELMKQNPPVPADAPIVNRMGKIGLVPGEDFDIGKYEAGVAAAIKDIPKTALAKIVAHRDAIGYMKNGWVISKRGGIYGTDYLLRATFAYFGLGANRPLDAIYPMAETDADGGAFNGAKKYVMHFDRGELPPVNAFWSLTMYNGEMFFVANPLNRYTLSQRDKLKFNPDGSVDFYVQAGNPGREKEANWLPAPRDKFVLMMRLYWPKETPPSILDGTWNPPAVQRAN
uniref:DUF1254 domain-containing protein n=1 Tax=Solibacter usitatus (strain Ellin6076) TaxID=234267 RepID=Q021M8_SOLUE